MLKGIIGHCLRFTRRHTHGATVIRCPDEARCYLHVASFVKPDSTATRKTAPRFSVRYNHAHQYRACVKGYVSGFCCCVREETPRSLRVTSLCCVRVVLHQLAAQLEAKTEEGQTALHIATRAGYVSTWRAVTSRMSGDEVRRQEKLLLLFAPNDAETETI